MSLSKFSLLCGIIGMALAVVLGAFGAHALKTDVTADMITVWQTGVSYQMIHSLALILLSLWMIQVSRPATVSLVAFIVGIFLFSGSLYALVLSGVKGFGAITPVGGLLFIAGWVSWAVRVWKHAS